MTATARFETNFLVKEPPCDGEEGVRNKTAAAERIGVERGFEEISEDLSDELGVESRRRHWRREERNS